MREFKVIVEDKTSRYAVIWEDEAGKHGLTLLTNSEVKRVVSHLLFPEINQHKINGDKLCKLCTSARD